MYKLLSIFIVAIILLASTCRQPSNEKNSTPKLPVIFTDPALADVPDSLKYLIPILDTVYRTDQKYRNTSGIESLAKQAQIDAANLVTVKEILDKYGFLGLRDVGFIGKNALYMVILHSDSKTQLHYYPLLVKAVDKKKATFGDLAMYEDKLNLNLRRLQYYGTQLTNYNNKTIPYPIHEPDSLDFRRKQMRLGSMNDYLKGSFNLDWDLSSFKKIQTDIISYFKIIVDSPSIHTDVTTLRKSIP